LCEFVLERERRRAPDHFLGVRGRNGNEDQSTIRISPSEPPRNRYRTRSLPAGDISKTVP
jgi:hypothetical protein